MSESFFKRLEQQAKTDPASEQHNFPFALFNYGAFDKRNHIGPLTSLKTVRWPRRWRHG